jgi:hypothetical protein
MDVPIHVVLVKHENGLCGVRDAPRVLGNEKRKTYLSLRSNKILHISGFQSPSIRKIRDESTFFTSDLVTNKHLQAPQSTDETQRLGLCHHIFCTYLYLEL